jgi:hypothetical protein
VGSGQCSPDRSIRGDVKKGLSLDWQDGGLGIVIQPLLVPATISVNAGSSHDPNDERPDQGAHLGGRDLNLRSRQRRWRFGAENHPREKIVLGWTRMGVFFQSTKGQRVNSC